MPSRTTDREDRRARRERWFQKLAFVGALLVLGVVLSLAAVARSNQRARERIAATIEAESRATATAIVQRTGTAEARATATAVVRVQQTATVAPYASARAAYWREILPLPAGSPIPRSLEVISADNASGIWEVARWGKGWATATAWSSDGQTLAVGTPIGVHLYDAKAFEEKLHLETSSSVWGVAFSPDSTLLAVALTSNMQLVDMATGREVAMIERDRGTGALSFSPDGNLLAAGSQDGSVRLWDVATLLHAGRSTDYEARLLLGHTGGVEGIAFSPDGALLSSGSEDGTVRLWDISTLAPGEGEGADTGDGTTREIAALETHSEDVHTVTFSPNGNLLTVAAWDGTVQLWDVSALALREGLPPEDGAVRELWALNVELVLSVAFSPDGQFLASVSWEGTVQLREAATGQVVEELQSPRGLWYEVGFSPDGALLRVWSRNGVVSQWPLSAVLGDQAQATPEIRALEGHSGRFCRLAFSPNGALLATAWDDGTVRLWDVTTGQVVQVLEGESSPVGSVTFSPDGNLLVVSTGGSLSQWMQFSGVVQMWELETGRALPVPQELSAAVYDVAFSPEGTLLAAVVCRDRFREATGDSACADSEIRLWDLSRRTIEETGAVVSMLEEHPAVVGSVAFSPDGALLAVGEEDGTIRLWDVASGREVRALEGHSRPASRLIFSPDGTLLATTGPSDDNVRLWNVATGSEMRVFAGSSEGGVMDIAFSPDGNVLAGVGSRLLLWDVESRNFTITDPDTLPFLPLLNVAFSPDGTLIATST